MSAPSPYQMRVAFFAGLIRQYEESHGFMSEKEFAGILALKAMQDERAVGQRCETLTATIRDAWFTLDNAWNNALAAPACRKMAVETAMGTLASALNTSQPIAPDLNHALNREIDRRDSKAPFATEGGQ